MCGIVAATGKFASVDYIKKTLKEFESRGGDSAGIAIANDGVIEVSKTLLGVEDIDWDMMNEGYAALGHIRWASVGGVSLANAHPILSCDRKIAVAQVGFIFELHRRRSYLETAGHSLVTQTDTELLPHILEEGIKKGKGVLQALDDVMSGAVGRMSAVFLLADGRFAAISKQLPILYYVAEDGSAVITTDADVFPREVDRFMQLSSGSAMVLEQDGSVVVRGRTKEVDLARLRRIFPVVELPDPVNVKKEIDGVTAKEIMNEPEAMASAIETAVKSPDYPYAIEGIREADQIVLLASGSSYNAANMIKPFMREGFGGRKDVHVIMSSAMTVDDVMSLKGLEAEQRTLLAISQSGDTPDTVMLASRLPAGHKVAVVNKVNSELARRLERIVYAGVGQERGIAATKSVVGEIIAIYSIFAGARGSGISAAIVEQVYSDMRRTSDIAMRASLSSTAGEASKIIVMSHSHYKAIADELALKLIEFGCKSTIAIPAGEMKYGTLAMVDENTLTVAIIPPWDLRSKRMILAALSEASVRGATAVVFVREGDYDTVREFRAFLAHPPLVIPYAASNDPLWILSALHAGHIFAYESALVAGRPIDRPRNITKIATD